MGMEQVIRPWGSCGGRAHAWPGGQSGQPAPTSAGARAGRGRWGLRPTRTHEVGGFPLGSLGPSFLFKMRDESLFLAWEAIAGLVISIQLCLREQGGPRKGTEGATAAGGALATHSLIGCRVLGVWFVAPLNNYSRDIGDR